MSEEVHEVAPARRSVHARLAAVSAGKLVAALVAAEVVELAVYRLALPALAPPGATPPPPWHVALSYLGLFAFYFAAALAALLIVVSLARGAPLRAAGARRRGRLARGLGAIVVAGGLTVVALGFLALARPPGEDLSLALELVFVGTVLALLVAQIGRGGDLGARVGLTILAAPLILHVWGPLSIRWLVGEEARWTGLIDRLHEAGIKLLVIAAVTSPYCFAPRPVIAALARRIPRVLSTFVLAACVIVVRTSVSTTADLMAAFGLDLGAGLPAVLVLLYTIAIVTLAWTILAALTAASLARRRIGAGLALLALAGYGFAWPLQLLVDLAALLVIGGAAVEVAGEERAGRAGVGRGRAIADETWLAWLRAVTARLRDHGGQAVTVRDETEGAVRSHVVATVRGLPIRLTIEREGGAVREVDVLVGVDPGGASAALLLEASDEAGRGRAPGRRPPPSVTGARQRTGDAAFDRRFRVVGEPDTVAALFGTGAPPASAGPAPIVGDDAGVRARAAATLDGWLALWPGLALRHRLHPGDGTPLDHPIPISELSSGGAGPPPTAERVAALLELLIELAERGGLAPPAAEPPAATASEVEP